ncbi:MAG TPA: halocyanin domain-containing protein [Natronoarchaeum rubrum]|nr:halocyanin domain-containing protein [Natronoarchaeum rubrum]
MDDSDRDGGPRFTRRSALRRTLGAGTALGAASVAGSGSALAQQNESGNESGGDAGEGPDWGDWFSNVSNYQSTQDLRGQDSVTVAVGAGNGFLFDPPAIWVDPGTTVTWEWTGEGVPHNVVHEGGDAFGSDLLSEEGATFEHTFEEDGQYRYICEPHVGAGMKGGVAVGDVSEQAGGGGGGDGGEESGGSGGIPPMLQMIGAAFIVAFLSPLLFALFLFSRGNSGGDAGGQREYSP